MPGFKDKEVEAVVRRIAGLGSEELRQGLQSFSFTAQPKKASPPPATPRVVFTSSTLDNAVDGSSGDDGDDAGGEPGGIGPTGATGATGAQFFDDTTGATGAMGPPGDTGATGATGMIGIPGDPGPAGPDGQQGDPGEKTAIVRTSVGPVQLVCIESPESRFVDYYTFLVLREARTPIDPLFLETCEPGSVQVISAVASLPILLSAKVQKDCILTETDSDSPCQVTVGLSGIRLGCAGRRFVQRTEEEMHYNNEFWKSATRRPKK